MSDLESKRLPIYNMKFPEKLWSIVNNCETGAIGWGLSGETIVLEYSKFLPEYLGEDGGVFKTGNIASFVRQLNLYGFRKCSRYMEQVNEFNEFKHPLFVKGRKDLLHYVKRSPGSSANFKSSRKVRKPYKVKKFLDIPKQDAAAGDLWNDIPETLPEPEIKRNPLNQRQELNIIDPMRQMWWNTMSSAPYSAGMYCGGINMATQAWMLQNRPLYDPFSQNESLYSVSRRAKLRPEDSQNKENCFYGGGNASHNLMLQNTPLYNLQSANDSLCNDSTRVKLESGDPQNEEVYYYGGGNTVSPNWMLQNTLYDPLSPNAPLSNSSAHGQPEPKNSQNVENRNYNNKENISFTPEARNKMYYLVMPTYPSPQDLIPSRFYNGIIPFQGMPVTLSTHDKSVSKVRIPNEDSNNN